LPVVTVLQILEVVEEALAAKILVVMEEVVLSFYVIVYLLWLFFKITELGLAQPVLLMYKH
jgi:hypothetical protein